MSYRVYDRGRKRPYERWGRKPEPVRVKTAKGKALLVFDAVYGTYGTAREEEFYAPERDSEQRF